MKERWNYIIAAYLKFGECPSFNGRNEHDDIYISKRQPSNYDANTGEKL